MKKLDLYLAASDFARANLDVTDAHDLDGKLWEEAKAKGYAGADYDYFKATAVQLRQTMLALRMQNAPSARPTPRVQPAPAKPGK